MLADRRTILTLLGAAAVALLAILIINRNGHDDPRPALTHAT